MRCRMVPTRGTTGCGIDLFRLLDPELVFKYLSMTSNSKKTASAGPAWTSYMLLVMLAVAMDQSIIVPSIQHFMHSMGVLQEGEATRWASWALSSFPLVQAFATPLLSSLADYKFGLVPVNAGCLMLMAGACLLYGLSQHPAHVILSRAIAGLASGACMLPYVWILRMGAASSRARASAMLRTAANLGYVVAPAIAATFTLMDVQLGPHLRLNQDTAPGLLMALIFLVLGVSGFAAPRPPARPKPAAAASKPAAAGEPSSSGHDTPPPRRLVKSWPATVCALLLAAVPCIHLSALQAVTFDLVSSHYGWDVKRHSLLWVYMGGLQLLASLGLIVIAPLIDDRLVTAVGVAAQVLSLLLFMEYGNGHGQLPLASLLCSVLSCCIAYTILTTTSLSLIGRLTPDGGPPTATFLSAYRVATLLTRFIGPVYVAHLLALTGPAVSPNLISYGLLALTAAMTALLVATYSDFLPSANAKTERAAVSKASKGDEKKEEEEERAEAGDVEMGASKDLATQ